MYSYLIKTIVIVVLIGNFTSDLNAQADATCYEQLMHIADSLYAQRNYQLAYDQYDAARDCLDITPEDDLKARVKRDSARSRQILTMQRNRAELKKQYDSLQITKAELETTNSELDDKRKALEIETQNLIAEQKRTDSLALINEALKLESLANQEIKDSNYNDAMQMILLSSLALDSINKELFAPMYRQEFRLLRQTFCRAVFEDRRKDFSTFNSNNLSEVSFDNNSDRAYLKLWRDSLIVHTYHYKESDATIELAESGVFVEQQQYASNVSVAGNSEYSIVTHLGGRVNYITHESNTSSLVGEHAGSDLTHAEFFSNGDRLVLADRFGQVHFYTITSGQAPKHVATSSEVAKHEAPVHILRCSNSGEVVLTAGLDKDVRIWNHTGSVVNSINLTSHILAMDFVSGTNDFYVVTADGNLIYSDQHGKYNTNPMHDGPVVLSSILSHDNVPVLLTCGTDGNIRLNALSGSQSSMPVESVGATIVHASLSEDGNRLVVATDTDLLFFEVEQTGISELGRAALPDKVGIHTCEISSDGNYALTVASDHSLNLWFYDGSLLLNEPASDIDRWGAGFTPDGKSFWSCSRTYAWVCPLPDLVNDKRRVFPYDLSSLTEKYNISTYYLVRIGLLAPPAGLGPSQD